MTAKIQQKVNGKRLPNMLRAERDRRGHTLRMAAVELDSSAESVRNWETGFRAPMKEKLIRIAAYLNVPPSTVTKYWVQDRRMSKGAEA